MALSRIYSTRNLTHAELIYKSVESNDMLVTGTCWFTTSWIREQEKEQLNT